MQDTRQKADLDTGPDKKEPAFWVLKVLNTNEIMYCNGDCQLDVSVGSHVIVPTKFGPDLAEVIGPSSSCQDCPVNSNAGDDENLVEPLELAGSQDMEEYEVNLERSRDAFAISQDLIRQHNLNMKLVRVHYVLRESRIVFFFTSEKRVDFRALVRDLVGHFRARIELRQIGVRDEARMVGGRGVCGRSLCCATVSNSLEPVSIKMAKTQKLSLNSQKISGPCGRLLCCLSFEYETYQQEQRGFPREGQWILDGEQRQKINEVNILSKKIYSYDRDGIKKEYISADLKYSSDKNAWLYVNSPVD